MCALVAAGLAQFSDTVFVSDGGEVGQWAQAFIASPHRVINGPAGAIGASLPFALAAKLARPAAQVVAVLGDGSFGFHMAEFDTAVRYACRSSPSSAMMRAGMPSIRFSCATMAPPARMAVRLRRLHGTTKWSPLSAATANW